MTAEPAEDRTGDPLLVDRTDGVVTLTFNRPESLNSLDLALKLALREAIDSAEADRACRAVVLAGAGRAFCVGQDLKEHVEALATTSAAARQSAGHGGESLQPARTATGRTAQAGGGRGPGDGGRRGGFAGASGGLSDRGAEDGLPHGVRQCGTGRRHGRVVDAAAPGRLRQGHGDVDARRTGRSRGVPFGSGCSRGSSPPTRRCCPRPRSWPPDSPLGPPWRTARSSASSSPATSGDLDQALEAEAEAQRIAGATDDHRNATAAFVAKEKPTFTGA